MALPPPPAPRASTLLTTSSLGFRRLVADGDDVWALETLAERPDDGCALVHVKTNGAVERLATLKGVGFDPRPTRAFVWVRAGGALQRVARLAPHEVATFASGLALSHDADDDAVVWALESQTPDKGWTGGRVSGEVGSVTIAKPDGSSPRVLAREDACHVVMNDRDVFWTSLKTDEGGSHHRVRSVSRRGGVPRTLFEHDQSVSDLAVGDAWIVFDVSGVGTARMDLATGRAEILNEKPLRARHVEGRALFAVQDGDVFEARFPPIGRVATRWLTADPAAPAREFAVGDHVVWFVASRGDVHTPELRFTPR
jgi:hypothetical protein